MRAIIIDDKDARALLNQLELCAFERTIAHCGAEHHDQWNALPAGARNALVEAVHRRFHFVVTRWLQDQGCTATR